jgi:hypothetical protein
VEELIARLKALEASAPNSSSLGKDFRVIEMHLARAEDKVLRIARGSSWTRVDLPLWKTEGTG